MVGEIRCAAHGLERQGRPHSPVWDVVKGLLLPVGCVLCDPFVSTATRLGGPGFPVFPYPASAYGLMTVAMTTLVMSLVSGARPSRGAPLIGGALWTGGVFALLLGIVLLPFSVIGLMVRIGVFGFTPFLTAAVYLRHRTHVVRAAAAQRGTVRTAAGVLAGVLPATLPHALVQRELHRMAAEAVPLVLADPARAGDFPVLATAAEWNLVATSAFDPIVRSYLAAHDDQDRRDVLERAYEALTGRDMRQRRLALTD